MNNLAYDRIEIKAGDIVYIPSSVTAIPCNYRSGYRMMTLQPQLGTLITLHCNQEARGLFGDYCKVLIKGELYWIEDKYIFPYVDKENHKEIFK
jgi:hypothetical protein